MSQPWMKFYTSDWRAAPELRMCSLAARAMWMEMICVMHEADPYGSLLVGGKPVAISQIASLAGASLRETEKLVSELENSGVFSRDIDGVIYSRRMKRDYVKSLKDRENGRGGGNPALAKGVNPTVNGVDKAQIPEARSQSPEEVGDANASLVNAERVDSARMAKKQETIRTCGEWWNRLAAELGLPTIGSIKPSTQRESLTLARAREISEDFPDLDAGLHALGGHIRGSPLLRGERGDRSWRANYNWVMNATNFVKIMEGNYEVRKTASR